MMIVKVKPGGSGDISTKTLEKIQDVIIRTKLIREDEPVKKTTLGIQEEFLTSLISEVIRLRRETCQPLEFDPFEFSELELDDSDPLPPKKLSDKQVTKKLEALKKKREKKTSKREIVGATQTDSGVYVVKKSTSIHAFDDVPLKEEDLSHSSGEDYFKKLKKSKPVFINNTRENPNTRFWTVVTLVTLNVLLFGYVLSVVF